jgi:hypothetical protein
VIQVWGGMTGAGRRRVKPKGKDWICSCGRQLKYYWRNCPACGEARPGAR